MKQKTIFFIILICTVTFHLNAAENQTKEIILKNATIITGLNNQILHNKTIIVRNQKIFSITDNYSKPNKEQTRVIDLNGKYIIPGLIDSHFHIIPIHSEKSLEYALYNGITVVRDMAGDGSYLKDLQQAIKNGEVIGPDLYFSALMAGPEYIKNSKNAKMSTPPDYELGEAPFMRAVDEYSDIPLLILEAKEFGATGIKLYNDLSADLVEKLTKEAHKQGLYVWTHSYISPATPEEIVKAGVDTISHSIMLLFPEDWSIEKYGGSLAIDPKQYSTERLHHIFSLMKKHSTYLDPTILLFSRQIKEESEKAELVYKTTRLAHEMGVEFVAGTDIFMKKEKHTVHDLHDEIRLLVEKIGFTELEAIQAATINGAKVLGIENTHGTIETGKLANIIILNKNPLDCISNTREVDFVIKRGEIYRY